MTTPARANHATRYHKPTARIHTLRLTQHRIFVTAEIEASGSLGYSVIPTRRSVPLPSHRQLSGPPFT